MSDIMMIAIQRDRCIAYLRLREDQMELEGLIGPDERFTDPIRCGLVDLQRSRFQVWKARHEYECSFKAHEL